jgi:hypothetical protein
MQFASFLRPMVLSFVVWLAVPIEYGSFLIFSKLFSDTYLIVRSIERDMSSYKVPIYSRQILTTPEFSQQILQKHPQISNLTLQVGAEFFPAAYGTDGRTDRQTDRYYEANGRFLQFCERS